MQIDIYAPQPTLTLNQFDKSINLSQPQYIKSNIKSQLDTFLMLRDICTVNVQGQQWIYNENYNLVFDNGTFNMLKHDGEKFSLVASFINQ